MRLYTVIGLHDVLGTVSWRHIEAKTALGAMVKLAKELKGDNEFQVIAAVAGKHDFETPGAEEAYRAAYASDLAELDAK